MFPNTSLRLFTLIGVDVGVSFSYGLMILLCLFWYGPLAGIIAAIAISLSIIIHEFGHALVCKRYDLDPSIVLHGLGGLCYHRPASSDGREALIAAAGPLLQVLAGGAALGFFVYAQPLATMQGAILGGASSVWVTFASVFIGFSLFWGLINLLLPIWPLDGGKLFALLLRRFIEDDSARVWTLYVSLFLLTPIGVWALTQSSFLLIFIVFSIAIENYQMLQVGAPLFAHSSGVAARSRKAKASPFIKELMDDARRAYGEEDWREAARLCHQIRSTNEAIPEKMMDEIWKILGLATMKQGDYEEALAWLKRAPKSKEIEQAIATCEAKLEEPVAW